MDNIQTKIEIILESLCWWFQRVGDKKLNPKSYVFSENLLIEMFPEFEIENQFHHVRRELKIKLNRLQRSYMFNDIGFYDEVNFERLGAVQILQYNAILPKAWYKNHRTISDIVDDVGEKVNEIFLMKKKIFKMLWSL